jgi:hypothetical protein
MAEMVEKREILDEKIASVKKKIKDGFFYEKFLVSSKPYIRKNNMIIDKGLN